MPLPASEVTALGRKADLSEICWAANIVAWGEHCKRMKLCRPRVSAETLETTSTGTAMLSTWAISQMWSVASNVTQEVKQATETGKSSHSLSPSAGGILQEQAVTSLMSQSPSQSPQLQKSSLGIHYEHTTSITASFSTTSPLRLISVAQIITQLHSKQPSSPSLPPESRTEPSGAFLSIILTVSAIHSLTDDSGFPLFYMEWGKGRGNYIHGLPQASPTAAKPCAQCWLTASGDGRQQ